MTVSVVLNGARSATRVSDATRARIMDAADRLRYRPNAVARGLSRRRMDAIGLVAVVDGSDVNLYFLEILNGIIDAAARLGQNTTVFSIHDWEHDQKRILHFCDGRVDGMILLAPSFLPAQFAEALQHRTSFVMLHPDNVPAELNPADCIDVDNEGGAYSMTSYLAQQGHRRIAYFAASQNMGGPQQRLAGYRRGLAEAGIPYDESLVSFGEYSAESGRQQGRALLERRDQGFALPTAVFCANDAVASGCIDVMTEAGLRVPADISVAGFDDLLLARMTNPPLTTVRQPFRDMGRYAVERLMSHIDRQVNGLDGESRRLPAQGAFATELIIRGSVAAPRSEL